MGLRWHKVGENVSIDGSPEFFVLAYIRNRFHPLWRLRRLAWFRLLQTRVDFPVSLRQGKIRVFFFWLRDFNRLVSNTSAEPKTARCFETMLARFQPDCFWDIGANIGDYSWRVANWSDAIDIWMFEPDIRNLELLRRTLTRNRLGQVILYPVAVSDTSGVLEFLTDSVSGATGSLRDQTSNSWSLHSHYGSSAKRSVVSIDLDSLREKFDARRLLIKMDVEGAEDRVLQGAHRILREVQPIIFIECFELARIEWLRELDYLFLDLKEGDNFIAYPREIKEKVENEGLAGLM